MSPYATHPFWQVQLGQKEPQSPVGKQASVVSYFFSSSYFFCSKSCLEKTRLQKTIQVIWSLNSYRVFVYGKTPVLLSPSSTLSHIHLMCLGRNYSRVMCCSLLCLGKSSMNLSITLICYLEGIRLECKRIV